MLRWYGEQRQRSRQQYRSKEKFKRYHVGQLPSPFTVFIKLSFIIQSLHLSVNYDELVEIYNLGPFFFKMVS